MLDKPFSGLPTNIKEQKPEAVGVRIIGEVDPRTITREVFEKSPELLFHGSRKPINFSPEFNYGSKEYLTASSSATLGLGFYAIADRNEAINYSNVRPSLSGSVQRDVAHILPYKARMLDLRRKNKLNENAPVPRELVIKWRERFLADLKTKTRTESTESMLEEFQDEWENEYTEFLNQIVTKNREVDLRTLLDTVRYPSPSWTALFSDFMREEGYDGVVYNEGGERKEGRGGASYVFYNLSKIGTYENWNKL